MIVKIRTYGWKNYIANNWNRFDFILVIGSLPSLMEGFINLPDTSILLILRILRIFRIIRFFRFVPHLETVFAGLGRALKSSVFVILVLFIMNFLFSLMGCQLFSEIAPEYFGNPLRSSYTIFQTFTVEGWNEIPEVIGERLQARGDSQLIDTYIGLSRIFFVLVVLLGGIFGMSLANAIFVDEMTIDNNKLLEEKIDHLSQEIADLKEWIVKRDNNINP